MKKVLLANLVNYTGGGVRVTLNIAQALAEQGYYVILYALRGYDAEMLDKIHGVRLSKFINRNLRILYSKIPLGLKPAYIYHWFFVKNLKDLVDRLRPDIVVVFDDIPVFFAEDRYKDINVLLYSHLPLHFHKETRHIDSIRYRLIDHLHHIYASKYYYVGKAPSNWVLIANSTITGIAISKLFGRVDAIIHPPVNQPKYVADPRAKKRIIISIGVIEPTKRFEVALKSMQKIDSGHLIIIGHLQYKQYWRYLVKEVKRLNLENRVRFLLDVPDELKWSLLKHAMVLVHAKKFEPFGIAVAEGMAMGAVPIVYKGPLSGPWIDIVDKGKYGFGFKDEIDLSGIIKDLLSDHNLWYEWSVLAQQRASYFTYDNFRNKISEIFNMILAGI